MARARPKQALTAGQRRRADRIASLHRREEPLNVSAVKRHHPKLLAAVYAVEPFWGWRRALEAAGIAYDDIRIELTDHVVCLVCGARFRNQSTHLARKHGVDAAAYRVEYPDAELVCEAWRVMRASDQLEGGEFALPHWEPIWSREYVLDRI